MQINAVTDWHENDHHIFEHEVFRRKHPFLDMIDVSDEGLADLIDATPDEFIDVVTMGQEKTDKSSWRTGDLKGVSGKQAIEAAKSGRLWINLRNLVEFMPKYKNILEGVYDTFAANVPGYKSNHHHLGFIISSPDVQSFYHIDVSDTILWHLRGVKRVWVYPKSEPFISQKMLEGIMLNEIDEVDIPFDPAFDNEATVIDLQPGEMLCWPHNYPHRVHNHDMLNVSLSTEHFTLETMKRYGVYFTNGYFSRHLGMGPMSTTTKGLTPWIKGAIAAGLKKSGLQKEYRRQKIVSFRVDPTAPLGVRDIDPYPHKDFNPNQQKLVAVAAE